jgi:hypothetical protein
VSDLAERGVRPPGVRLVNRDQVVEGVEGSTTWRGIARDRLLQPPQSWLPVAVGSTLRFECEGPPADYVFLTVYQAGAVADRSMTALAGVELDTTQPSWAVQVPPGRYVITLSRTWEGSESVTNAFGIQVDESDAG